MNHSCSICLDELENSPTTLKCQHVFHEKCILKWVIGSKNCPICRTVTLIEEVKTPQLDSVIHGSIGGDGTLGVEDVIENFDRDIKKFIIGKFFLISSIKNRADTLNTLLKKYVQRGLSYKVYFYQAIVNGSLDVVKTFMEYLTDMKNPSLFDPTDNNCLAINLCVRNGMRDILDYLLFGTVKMNFSRFTLRRFFATVGDNQAMKIAVKGGDIEMIDYLLSLSRCPFELALGESWRVKLSEASVKEILMGDDYDTIELFLHRKKFNLANNSVVIEYLIDAERIRAIVLILKYSRMAFRKKVLLGLYKTEKGKELSKRIYCLDKYCRNCDRIRLPVIVL